MANRFVNESYTPGKCYPSMGILSAELPLDERGRNSVLRNLRGPESRFGEYRVVEYLGRIPKVRKKAGKITTSIFRIQCSCGYERQVDYEQLTNLRKGIKRGPEKHRPHCGSPQHQEEFQRGKRWDRLTIIDHAKVSWLKELPPNLVRGAGSPNQWVLLCSCSCGKHDLNNPYVCPSNYLWNPKAKGATKFGCGCRMKTASGLSNTPQGFLWQGASRRARKNKLPFNIDIHDCKIPLFCPALGIPLKHSSKIGPTDNSPTLDRLIPEKGYVKGNVRVISNKANRLKNDGNYLDLLRISEWLKKELKE